MFHFVKKVNKGQVKMRNINYKNGQISFHCYFKKILKGPGTSFHSQALNQKHIRNVCHTAHYYLSTFHFDSS